MMYFITLFTVLGEIHLRVLSLQSLVLFKVKEYFISIPVAWSRTSTPPEHVLPAQSLTYKMGPSRTDYKVNSSL